jgi:phosphatidylserine/phosphatidylglycerophosphate/cardiolipin synthase-like enzyme
MRNKKSEDKLSVRAIAGTHVVILAWDMKPEATPGLIGFAVERTQFKVGAVLERFWLRGIKRFEDKDKGLPAGTPVPTSEHPVQSFQWGDYTAQPETSYRYRVVPVYGQPLNLELRETDGAAVDISTEAEMAGEHAVYFNRGLAGSQAYARQFTSPIPNADAPDSPQMKWLSRGLYEALIAFIGRAKDSSWGLRAALYEFHYEPVGRAFRQAIDAGADVRIIYDAPNYGAENTKMVNKLKLAAHCQKRAAGGYQKHNKYIVLLKNNEPVEVWTGSTNISAGGIFGHSNVGHQVRNKTLARKYLDYWNTLAQLPDPPIAKVEHFNEAATPTPPGMPAANTLTALFSPRPGATLQWYADRMDGADEIVCFTIAFQLAKSFENVLKKEDDVLRYVVSDKRLAGEAIITADKDVIYAAGAKFEKGDLPQFLPEALTGLNNNNYIHDKFMLIDPLSDDPTTVSGSANFSGASQTDNDENMLVIRSDLRVADIYFGEFMRIFDHLYARYLARKIRDEEAAKAKAAGGKKAKAKPGAGYLKPDDSWVAEHFNPGPKSRRRQYFHGAWLP